MYFRIALALRSFCHSSRFNIGMGVLISRSSRDNVMSIRSLTVNGSFERISDTLNSFTDRLFCGRAFDGEGVGRGTGLGFLYAWHFLDGTDDGGLAILWRK